MPRGQRIEFTTDDGIRIVGNWTTAPTTVGAAILLHMMPSNKESWDGMQQQLAHRGIASLAIDLRGHGESTQTVEGAAIDYRAFTDAEHAESIQDAIGAHAWIRARGIEDDRIGTIGASVGANLSLQLLQQNPTMPCAVLLSPGLDYRGVDAMNAAKYVTPEQSVFIVASAEDDDESVEASEQIMDALEIETKLFKRLKRVGHGTAMIEGDAVLAGEIADWVRDRIQNFEL
ncbi:MAG: alpha/beta fold hydrolase [Patescibacteria group bacterium]